VSVAPAICKCRGSGNPQRMRRLAFFAHKTFRDSRRFRTLVGRVRSVGMSRLRGRCWLVALCIALGGILLLSEQVCSATLQLPLVSDESQLSLGKIVARMVAYRQWQDKALREYEARRRFYAWNERFNINSTLEVRTIFRWPYLLQSTVLRQEGSTFIREHVFE